jgi:formate dehydrogenase subunit beta
MDKVLKLNKSAEEGIRELLIFLLEHKKVSAVLTLTKTDTGISYSLITDTDALKYAVPLFPLMPANAGGLLSRLTLTGSVNKPVAAVLKPCELRAFVELVKREQGDLKNLLLISSTCGGVYPLKMAANDTLENKLKEYWNTVNNLEIASDIRPTCGACQHFIPYNADITVALIGKDTDKECEMFLNTDEGRKAAEGIEGEIVEGELNTEELKQFRNKREDQKEKLFDEIKVEEFGMEGLINTFGKCIGCHGCSKVCPICYCSLCDFDSRTHEYEPSAYDTELEKRGGVRVPPNTVFYHIGRITHVSISCVGCGMCADVCPADIPLSTIFLKAGESVQNIFDYLPGRDLEEKIPLTTFEEKELTEVES